MSLIKKIVSGLGILCAFGCSNNDEQQRQELLKWLDFQISQISEQIESDIEKEKEGLYPHQGKTQYNSIGRIDYELKEKTDERLNVSKHSLLTLSDIQNTEGYKQLASKTNELNVQLGIKTVDIDGDEVESYEEIDEYIDDQEHYFVITLSGWITNNSPDQL